MRKKKKNDTVKAASLSMNIEEVMASLPNTEDEGRPLLALHEEVNHKARSHIC